MLKRDYNRTTRRNVLRTIGTGIVASGIATVGSAQSSSNNNQKREYKQALSILDNGGDLEEFEEYLEEHNYQIAKKQTHIENAAPSAKDDGEVSTQSAYQRHEDVDLTIYLYYDLDEVDGYVAQATWQWSGQTLKPADAIGITYKEDSWYVPQNGYDSSSYVTLETEDRNANGYGWTYNDRSDTLDGDASQRWATLELKPYDEEIEPEARQIWMAYTQTSSPYGGAASVSGVSVGYGVLSVSLDNCISCTKDTWLEDKNGDELKISQADATPLS